MFWQCLPRRGTASEVFVIWFATNREKTVWDSRIVTSENETVSLQKTYNLWFLSSSFHNIACQRFFCVELLRDEIIIKYVFVVSNSEVYSS